MSVEHRQETLEVILKYTLEECVSLARKKIRSKKGITDLQTLLIDYRQNTELANIILEVIRLITVYENNKKDENDEIKDSVPIDQYHSLQTVLQKYESTMREQIRNQQQLKIYCEELEDKNKQLEKNNEELLRSTKQIITNLKRQSQRLIEQNHKMRDKVRENNQIRERESSVRESRDKEESIIDSIKKARKFVDSYNSKGNRQQSSIPQLGQRSSESMKSKRNSLKVLQTNK